MRTSLNMLVNVAAGVDVEVAVAVADDADVANDCVVDDVRRSRVPPKALV